VKISERQQEILDYLDMGYALTCYFSPADGFFDASLEGLGSRDVVSLPTLKAMIGKKLIEEKHRSPMSGDWQQVHFKAS